jgi:hypothetical protein
MKNGIPGILSKYFLWGCIDLHLEVFSYKGPIKTHALFLGVSYECVVLFHRGNAAGFIFSASLEIFSHFPELPFTHKCATDAILDFVLVLPLFLLQKLVVALLTSPSCGAQY